MTMVTHLRMAASDGMAAQEREKYSKDKDVEYEQQIRIYLEYIYCFLHIISRKIFFEYGEQARDRFQDHIWPVLFSYLADDLIKEETRKEGIRNFYQQTIDADQEYGDCDGSVAPLGVRPTNFINVLLARRINNILYKNNKRLDILSTFCGASIINFHKRINTPNVKKYIKQLTV